MITWILEKVVGVVVGWFPEQYKTLVELACVLIVAVVLFLFGTWAGVQFKQSEVDRISGRLEMSETQYKTLTDKLDKFVGDSDKRTQDALLALQRAAIEAGKLQPSITAAQKRLDALYALGLPAASGVPTSCEIEVIKDKETR